MKWSYGRLFTSIGADGGGELGAEEPEDWYASQGKSTEKISQYFKDSDRRFWREADFDPHYVYELVVTHKGTQYELQMMPAGGMIICFQETGTCKVDGENRTLTLTPELFTMNDSEAGYTKRPEELRGVTTFQIEASKANGGIKFRLRDSKGKVWER